MTNKEYTRLRDIARKRAMRRGTPFAIPKLADIQNNKQMSTAIRQLESYIKSTSIPLNKQPKKTPQKKQATPLLHYPIEDLTKVFGKSALTHDQQIAEYNRLRAIANKRLARMSQDAFASTTRVYNYNKNLYKPASKIKTPQELRYLLHDVTRFLTAKEGTLRGIKSKRDKVLAALSERGFVGVTEANFTDFTNFMAYAKAKLGSLDYPSDELVELFEEARATSQTDEEFVQKINEAFDAWTSENALQVEEKLRGVRF